MDSVLFYNFTLSLAGIIMIIAAFNDVRELRIPNATVLALLLLFPVFVFASPSSVPWIQHLGVFAIMLVCGYGLYAMKWVGAGDIKLIAACGLWAGPHYWGHFLFIMTLTGGILGLTLAVIAILRRQFSKNKEEEQPSIAKAKVPYGVAIAVGGICALALLSHPELAVGKV